MCTRAVLTESRASKRTWSSPAWVLRHVSVTVWGKDPNVMGAGLVQVRRPCEIALKFTVPV